jgi:transcriptional regulator with XRE-family HTH domain
MKDGMEIFAKRIRDLRNEKNMTVRVLAEELGISHPAISTYENCQKEAPLSVLRAYASYFNTTIDYLVGLSDER